MACIQPATTAGTLPRQQALTQPHTCPHAPCRSPKDSTQHLLSGSGPASCAPQQAGKEGSDSGAIVVKVDAHGGRQANAALGGLLTSAVSPSRRGLELAMSSSQL